MYPDFFLSFSFYLPESETENQESERLKTRNETGAISRQEVRRITAKPRESLVPALLRLSQKPGARDRRRFEV